MLSRAKAIIIPEEVTVFLFFFYLKKKKKKRGVISQHAVETHIYCQGIGAK